MKMWVKQSEPILCAHVVLRMPTAWVWGHSLAPGIDQETQVSHLLKWQNEVRVQASCLHTSSPQHQLSAAVKARHGARYLGRHRHLPELPWGSLTIHFFHVWSTVLPRQGRHRKMSKGARLPSKLPGKLKGMARPLLKGQDELQRGSRVWLRCSSVLEQPLVCA